MLEMAGYPGFPVPFGLAERSPMPVRGLFARLTGIGQGPRGGEAPLSAATLPKPAGEVVRDADTDCTRTLRAAALAAYRDVEGPEGAAIDAALVVMEAELARLRGSLREFGEALKAVRVYGMTPEQRGLADAALRRAPIRLDCAPPVPRDLRHG